MKKTLMRPAGPPSSASTPLATPLYPSVAYAAEHPDALDAQYEGAASGYTYAREGHPNADVVAARIDQLEGLDPKGGPGGVVTGSGMAAIAATLMGLCRAGDHVVGADQLYGRSLRLLTDDLPRLGIAATLADPTALDAVAAALRPETRLVLIEVVSNPTLRIADLDGVAALCRARGVLLAVDNTFTTPRMVRPFERGADIVIHSITKMLAGHSDATLGYVAARDPELRRRLGDFTVTAGLTPSPFDCWLADRGLASFPLRFDRAQATAGRLAAFLAEEPAVRRVLYPTRADHPDQARTATVLGGAGGPMVSFELAGAASSASSARAAANALTMALGAAGVAFAPTLGDVGTTLSHPASSSHRGLTPEARAAIGVSDGFFRVSVGLEEPDALIAAFAAGLAAAAAA